MLGECCDVCSKLESVATVSCEKEMTAIAQTVKEAPGLGEKKVCSHFASHIQDLTLSLCVDC